MLMVYSNEAYAELSTANFTSIFVVIYIGVFPGALGYLFWVMLLEIFLQQLLLARYILCLLFLYF